MSFSLSMYPVTYVAQYNGDTQKWDEQWIQHDSVPFADLQKMTEHERNAIYAKRNHFDLPLVNYTTQYAQGCFEGMKAYPHKNGSVSIFRPDRNAKRFADSMRGLYCPAFPEDLFEKASIEFVRKNIELGYIPKYENNWEADNFASGEAVYIRPFMYTEGAIGIGTSKAPYVIICATTVSSYFKNTNSKAVITKRVRATPNGTGCIKCASNYVISSLAKYEAEQAGFMEVIFLDSTEHKYLEEGSSCNIFVHLNSGELVTPELGDTILPGITRSSVIDLARKTGVTVSERRISLEEALRYGAECFVTGTAAGITPIESITHKGVETVFNNRVPGELGQKLQKQLKGIQYGTLIDEFGWNVLV